MARTYSCYTFTSSCAPCEQSQIPRQKHGHVPDLWDKLFGTFQPELEEKEYQPIKYGLTSPLKKETPVTIVFHEWSNIWKDITRTDITWKEKWFYLFGPPGWSHDGSRLTSEEMRVEENAQEGNSTILQEERVPLK